jgi:hypothetical protein
MQGRGVRVEIPGEGGETLLLKKKRRGGLAARLMGDIYRKEYEALSEVMLSELAWKKGVPVAPLAFAMAAPAGEGRLRSGWRAYEASVKVPGAHSLMDWLSMPLEPARRREVLAAAGACVQRAHNRGFAHGDLNLGNILVSRSERGEYGGLLIDLAHSVMGRTLTFNPRIDQLVRLYRSAEKWLPDAPRRRMADIVIFLNAYTAGDAGETRRILEASARHRGSLMLHRLGWKARRAGAVRPRRPSPAKS